MRTAARTLGEEQGTINRPDWPPHGLLEPSVIVLMHGAVSVLHHSILRACAISVLLNFVEVDNL